MLGAALTVQAGPNALAILTLDDGGGTRAQDTSGQANDGSLEGGAAFEATSGDGSPSSVRFSRAGDRIDLGALDVNGSGLTLAAWFKARTFPGPASDARIVSKASGTAPNDHVFMLSTRQLGSAVRLRARVRINGTTTTLIADRGDLVPGVWQHAIATYDGAALRLYLDGREVGSTPLSGPVDRDPALPVAVGNQPAGAGDRHFDGWLDYVLVLQRPRRAAEIAFLSSSRPLPVAADDRYTTDPEMALVVDAANTGVLANDSGAGPDPLEAVLVDDVSHGSLVLDLSGSFSYTPDPGFLGTDRFNYQATDGVSFSDAATASIVVGNDSPPQVGTGTLSFAKAIVDDQLTETHAVVAADLTGDGLIDLAATDYVSGSVFWYENDGLGGFSVRVLDGNLEGAYPAHVADVDSDGDADVLATGYLADAVVWYESDGTGGFTKHVVDSTADGAHSVATGDMDKDGDVDLLAANQDAGTITWYENDGANNFVRHLLDPAAFGAKRADFADLDQDGDMDVVSASHYSNEVAWHENDGNQNFTKWIIDPSADGSYYASTADLDGDGDLDVLAANQLDNAIMWYENDGGGRFVPRAIDTNALGARTVIGADVDGDGDMDLVTASADDDTVGLYVNDGTGSFTKRAIDSGADGAYGVFAIDMDGDGDTDIVSASSLAGVVAIHTQTNSIGPQ